MNKQQAIERLDALEAEAKKLREIIDQPEVTLEQRFWELILQTDSIKIDKREYPNLTFGFMGDNFLWEYDAENKYLWLAYSRIWEVLEKEFGYIYSEIQGRIKVEIEAHFKCKGVAPCYPDDRIRHRIEALFKCKGVAPLSPAEMGKLK